jgi:hypothetical protein
MCCPLLYFFKLHLLLLVHSESDSDSDKFDQDQDQDHDNVNVSDSDRYRCPDYEISGPEPDSTTMAVQSGSMPTTTISFESSESIFVGMKDTFHEAYEKVKTAFRNNNYMEDGINTYDERVSSLGTTREQISATMNDYEADILKRTVCPS